MPEDDPDSAVSTDLHAQGPAYLGGPHGLSVELEANPAALLPENLQGMASDFVCLALLGQIRRAF